MTANSTILDGDMHGSSKMQPRRACGLLIAICTVLAGCGRDQPAAPNSKAASVATDAAAGDTGAAAPSVQTGARDPRTKWIGNVPYDVFFDRPLETYQQSADTGAADPGITVSSPDVATPDVAHSAVPTTPETASSSATDPAKATNDGGATAVDWTTVAPISLLEAETKEIRSRLSANLQTVATFNANTDAIETDGSVLALVAAIIERHSGEVNWQDRAPFVRQLAYDIYLNASGKGRGPFEKTKEPFEKVVNIWDGGPAPDMEAAPLVPLGEVGDRAQVMLRFESGFNWLRADINTATRLKEEQDRVVRETTVLAALGTALTDSTFDGADQEAYRALLQQFIDGQTQMTSAAADNDIAAFEQARSSVQKSCDACHLEYRNSGGSDQ